MGDVWGLVLIVWVPLIYCKFNEAEYAFLVDFHKATHGETWVNDNWFVGDPCSLWVGISCNPNRTRIKQLTLLENNLIGSIPDSIGNLSVLININLSNNRLSGTIPQGLFNIRSMLWIYIANNELSGTIPSMESLTLLQSLNLRQNNLVGSIPSTIGMAVSLTDLDLDRNKLSGSTNYELGLLSSLTQIDISYNMLTGKIPDSLGSMTNLSISNNKLDSTLPTVLTSATNLRGLDLSYNKINGTIPKLNAMTYLMELVLYDNLLTGTIPNLTGLTLLQTLDLSGNSFQGGIPTSIGEMVALNSLNLANCNLTGEIPSSIQTLTSLISLDLSSNQLTGTFPSAIQNLRKLTTIILRSNQITDISLICLHQPLLQTLDVTNNNLTFINWKYINNCTSLTALYLAHNKIKKVFLPEYSYLSVLDLTDNEIENLLVFNGNKSTKISSINMNNNNIKMTTKELADFLYQSTPMLTFLDLTNNYISGPLSDLYFYNSLSTLILNQNQITGDLSFFDKNDLPFQFLILGLSGNQISGRISNQITKLPYYTKELYLDNNNLTGELPPFLPDSIEVINLQNNQLVGTIPSTWGNLNRLRQINLEGNSICGCVPESWYDQNWVSCNLNGLKYSCNCTLPKSCSNILECDISVVDSKCGIDQCQYTHLCKEPRKCEPKQEYGYYYGYQCSDCTGIYENTDLYSCKPSLVIILGPALAVFFVILVIIFIVIVRKSLQRNQPILLPYNWFWDVSRIQKKGYSRSTQEPHYYYKKLTTETTRENELFLLLIGNLDFKDFEVKSSYAIASPILAQSVSNTLQIQRSRLNIDKTTFLSHSWKYDIERREKVISHFVNKCLEWDWNKEKTIEDCYILPVVHGTSTELAWKIASNGFASLSTLDEGYYGKGIYFTTSALYTVQYLSNKNRPAILICFVIPGNPYPVIENPLNAQDSFLGKHLMDRYQSHFCITNASGLPYTEQDEMNSTRIFDELVIDQESQIVPLFLVKVSFSDELVKAYTRVLPLPERTDSPNPINPLEDPPTERIPLIPNRLRIALNKIQL